MSAQVTPWYDTFLVVGAVVSVPSVLVAFFYLYARAFRP
jgi:hypothetical protein